MRLRWSLPAITQLYSIRAYIAKDNPDAASRVAAAIVNATDRLEQFPFLGRAGRTTGWRELVVPGLPYIVGYRIVDDVVDIASVLHTSRKWPE
jgi:addiction module RelE/StbE family toxin